MYEHYASMKITCPHCGAAGVDWGDSSLGYVGTDKTAAFWWRTQQNQRLYTCLACGGGMRKTKRFRSSLDPVPADEWAELERTWEAGAGERQEHAEAALRDEGGEELVAYYRQQQARRNEDKITVEERKAVLGLHLSLFDYSGAGWIMVAENPFGVVFDKGRSSIAVEVDAWGEVVSRPRGRGAEEFLRSRAGR